MKRMGIIGAFFLLAVAGIILLPLPRALAKEDCLPYNPRNLRIVSEGAKGFLLTDGRSRMLMLDNREDARKALALARRHTKHCFIGRDNRRPNRKDYIFEYWGGDSGITTSLGREDCIPYDPHKLHIVNEGARGWLLTDGRSRMAMLDNASDARRALAVARRHTRQCFIGRNNRRPNRKDYIVQYFAGRAEPRPGAEDKTPPRLSISYFPAKPSSKQKVTFIAKASDPGGITKVNILVNARMAKECTTPECAYTGGPYPPGTVTYGANAYDQAGNRAWTGYRSFMVSAAIVAPQGNSTIFGHLTGNRHLVRKMAAVNLDKRDLSYEVPVDANGNFAFRNLPDGLYRVYPVPPGKVSVVSNPREHRVRCKGRGTHRVNFEIVRIEEG
jgi:hypothetical protein